MDGIFCAIWLIPLSRNILHYLPPSKTSWRPVLFTLRKKNFFSINEVAMPDSSKLKSNENWQMSTQRYVFLLFFSDKCTQDVFENVLFTNDEWVTSRHQLPTSRIIVKISENCMWKQFREVYAKATIHLHFGEQLFYILFMKLINLHPSRLLLQCCFSVVSMLFLKSCKITN